uniref:RNA-directed RNA polymerase L n=1 Tax=Cryptotermes brevis phenuivirus 1 TaxID=3133458 RepID=A0AAT9J9Z5_9VIRU
MAGPILNLQNLLMEHLRDVNDIVLFRAPQLHCSKQIHIQEPSIYIPDLAHLVQIDQVEDVVTWSYIIEGDLAGSITLTSSERRTESRVKYKIRHEFVAETISDQGTDKQLGKEFEALGDDDDRITPDVIIRDQLGNVYVIEVGTSRSPNEASLIRSFNEKMFKYEMPLRNRRLDNPIVYCVIIVGFDRIISNYDLPTEIVDEMIVRMRLAVAIEDQAQAKGFNITSSEVQSQKDIIAQEISFRVSTIDPKDPPLTSKISITQEYINSILQDPSEEDALKSFKTALGKTKEDILAQRDQAHNIQLEKYMNSLPRNNLTRTDKKAIVQLPFILCKITPPSTSIPQIFLAPGRKEECLQRLWGFVFMQSQNSPHFFEENSAELLSEALELNINKIKQYELTRKAKRDKWHRVNIKEVLDYHMLNYLQKDGLFAKSAKNKEEIKNRKKEQKKPFSYDTDVSDIDKILNCSDLLNRVPDEQPLSSIMIADLIQKAEMISGNDSLGEVFFTEWSKTKLFRACDIISDIAMELAISIKQNSKSHEMILKKLRHYPVYLLIKTTNSQSHLFFSIYTPDYTTMERLNDTTFRTMNKLSRGYASDFVSVKISKIQNLANASSTLLTLAAFWAHFYGLDEAFPQNFANEAESFRMLMMTLLISLEDKAQTEEVITLSRYMYMEIFKGNINMMKSNPFKMLSKFPNCIRSRMTLWVIKQEIQNFERMINKPPRRADPNMETVLEEDEDALPGDEWIGLLNCFTGRQIRTSTAAVNLMYLGYFKNKNEAAEGNVEWKMIEKILEEEFEVNEREKTRYYGEIDPEEIPGKKQFNKNSVMFGCKLLESRLERKLGTGWRKILDDEICESLSRHLTHEISTLKATSVVSHTETERTADASSTDRIWRVKVIESIACKLGMTGLNPMVNIDKVLKFVETSSAGVICDLFKKNQHGGLREIYVLTVESRLIQLFIETISRTLCSHFEEETLTHPTNKLKILDDHKIRMAKIARKTNSIYADFCSSSDKTRWNQNFVMTAMIVPLIRLTDSKFHNVLYRSMNLWANKLILIPPVVIKLLMDKTPLSSPTYDELLKKFWNRRTDGKNKLGLKKPKSIFLNMTTGMMQGILHYTSSLLHLTLLSSHKHFTLKYMRLSYPDHKFYMSQVCSSDDSATILTVMSSSDHDRLIKSDVHALLECDIVLQTSSIFCRFFCMRESDKSTLSLYDYVEFNSEFLFKNTLAIPIVKFVAASLNLCESESFVNRFYIMYNLISDLYASGLPSRNTYYCQVAQAHQHYKSLGSSTNALFERYFDSILETPSPIYGFFLLDSQYCCGLLGYSYMRWQLAQNEKSFLNRLKFLQIGEVATLEDGGIVSSFSVKHGDSTRWLKMMDRIEEGTLNPKSLSVGKNPATKSIVLNIEKIESRKERIEQNPELFFRHPDNVTELRTKLLVKASMPGVSNSLGKGNPFIQSLSLSVYAINTHSFSQTSTTQKLDTQTGTHKIVKRTVKHSLLSALKEYKDLGDDPIEGDELDLLLDQVFPLRSKYEAASEVINSYTKSEWKPIHRLRVRKNFVTIQPRSSLLPLTLLQTCSKWWYGHSVKTSEGVYRKCRDEYRLLYPWLRDSFEDTLSNSPFINGTELFNFISTQSTRARRIMINCPTIRSNRFVGQVSQLIRRHYVSGYVLIRGSEEKSEREIMDKTVSSLSLSLLIPVDSIRVKKTQASFNIISEKYQSTEDLQGLSKRESSLGLMALLSAGKIGNLEAITHIRNLRSGTVISFTKEQILQEVDGKQKWKGEGECMVFSDGFVIKISLRDEFSTRIVVKNFDLLRRYPGIMINVFDQLSCKPYSTYVPKTQCLARFNGTRYVSAEGYGTPIILDSDLEDIFTDPPKLFIKPLFSKAQINYRRQRREFTLLEFRTGYSDISLYRDESDGNDFWDCWIRQKPVSPNEAFNFLSIISSMIRDPGTNPDLIKRYSKWIKDTLLSRLKYRRVGYAQEFYTDTIQEEGSSEIDMMDEMADELIMKMATGKPTEKIGELYDIFEAKIYESIRDRLEEEGENTADIFQEFHEVKLELVLQNESNISPFRALLSNYEDDEGAHSVSVSRREAVNFLYLHPIWDSLINDIIEHESGFFDKLVKGVVSAKEPELSDLLMTVLDIKKVEKEVSLLTRYKRMTPLRPMRDMEAEMGEISEELIIISSSDDQTDIEEEEGAVGYDIDWFEQQ